jgi:hypothetical protein
MFMLLGATTAIAVLATLWIGDGVPPGAQAWLASSPLLVALGASALARRPGRIPQPKHGRRIAIASVAGSAVVTLVSLGIATTSDPVVGRWLMGTVSTIDLALIAGLAVWALRHRTR